MMWPDVLCSETGELVWIPYYGQSRNKARIEALEFLGDPMYVETQARRVWMRRVDYHPEWGDSAGEKCEHDDPEATPYWEVEYVNVPKKKAAV